MATLNITFHQSSLDVCAPHVSIPVTKLFYRTQVSLGSDLWVWAYVRQSLHPRLFADLTDVTLADEDSNSIPTDDVNGQSQAMWQCK